MTLENMIENIIMGVEFNSRGAILYHQEDVDVILCNKMLKVMDMSLNIVNDREIVLKEYLELLEDDCDTLVLSTVCHPLGY